MRLGGCHNCSEQDVRVETDTDPNCTRARMAPRKKCDTLNANTTGSVFSEDAQKEALFYDEKVTEKYGASFFRSQLFCRAETVTKVFFFLSKVC